MDDFPAVEGFETQVFADQFGLLEFSGSTLEVFSEHARVVDAKLIRQGFADDDWHIGWIGKKSVEVTQGANLHGHTEFGVVQTAGFEQGLIGVFEMEEFSDVITFTPLAQTWENRKNVNPSKLALVKTLSV